MSSIDDLYEGIQTGSVTLVDLENYIILREEAGFDDGYGAGHSDGYDEGYDSGNVDGFEEGKAAAEDELG